MKAVALRDRAEGFFDQAERLGAGTDPILESAKSCEVLLLSQFFNLPSGYAVAPPQVALRADP